MKRFGIVVLLALFCTLAPCEAKVELPAVIGSNMVLQRNTHAKLWGRSNQQYVEVITSWDNRVYTANPDADGAWRVTIETPDAGGPYQIAIADGEPESLILENILIGEVWVCSGQSNMEMPVGGFDSQPCRNSVKTLLKAGAYPQIRLFHVARAASATPQTDCVGEWRQSSMASAATFSAAAYHFGLNLADALQVPIGLIESDWGATRIEAWMSETAAGSVAPDILDTNSEYDASNQVAALYNGMINPIAPFAARGFIWYQGESNKGYHRKYARDMAAMVSNWRELWGCADMPFYYVQLAPFDYDIPMHRFRGEPNSILLPLIVEAQIDALKLIPHSAIAVNTDLGDAIEIHPPYKDVVGERLALLALSKSYGMSGVECQGVMFKSVDFVGDTATVEFESQSTLMPIDVPIKAFEIAGADRVFYPAEAYVVHRGYEFSRKVALRSSKVKRPVAVRYAFRNVVDVNLTNTVGLPAFPFRTDDWDDVR